MHQSPLIADFAEIAIVPTPYLSSVVQQILHEKPLQNLDVVRLVHPKEGTRTWRLPVAFAVDYLLIHGMSISFLVFLLSLPVAILCLVILKQVV